MLVLIYKYTELKSFITNGHEINKTKINLILANNAVILNNFAL